MGKRVKVISESDSGRNQKFYDNYRRKTMFRGQFVKEIEQGKYPNYHIRNINSVKTPVSNPDNREGNNLG